ncbi:hypothetical protein MPSEU_000433200 [Mayamaea pseudoterrestris]|nr:hypothetical protein MPSEU_000433200 [Mayamaea pseudoterrestris]
MPELENILMRKTKQPYRVCRQLVLDSRETLGIGKYEPWTENLHDAAMRLWEARSTGSPSPHKLDAESTATTICSYSLDGSESHIQDKVVTVELGMQAMKEEDDLDKDEQANYEEPIGETKQKTKKTKKFNRLVTSVRRALLMGAIHTSKSRGRQPS